MENGIVNISELYFNSKVKIRFKNIMDGFTNHESRIITTKGKSSFHEYEKSFIRFLEDVYKLNKSINTKEVCFIDFYLKDLSDDEYKKL